MGEEQMDYVNVKIPRELSDRIDALMEAESGGYSSRAEFVKEAIRQKLHNSGALGGFLEETP